MPGNERPSKVLAAAVIVMIIVLSTAAFVLVQKMRPSAPSNSGGGDTDSEEEGSGIVFRFRDRYGIDVQAHLYIPNSSVGEPPYPAVVFSPGWKADNSIYTWVYDNLTTLGMVVMAIDFVNNSGPWAETQTGRITGMFCDSYNPGGHLPAIYSGDSTFWPDVYPWQNEIEDAIGFLVNATTQGITVGDENNTVDLTGLIDPDRVSVMGHSTGASMSLVTSFKDKRVKACLALAPYDDYSGSPYWPPYPSDYASYQGSVPVLIITGSQDKVTPLSLCSKPIYQTLGSPKGLVTVKGGNHMYFIDTDELYRPDIQIPDQTPIGAASINADEQKNISMVAIKRFFTYYMFGADSEDNSPYTLPHDVTGDGSADISLDAEEGDVIKWADYDLSKNVSYTFHAAVVPLGIGWGNSTVTLEVKLLSAGEPLTTYTMEYRYGTFRDQYAGEWVVELRRPGTYYINIVARSVSGKEYSRGFTAVMI